MTRSRTTQRDRVEQAVAFGRSLDWIIDQLGVESSYVDDVLRRMDVASRSKDADEEQGVGVTFPPATPEEIAELTDALFPRMWRGDQERIALVRDYAVTGCTDTEIAALIGSTRKAVGNLRSRNGIPAGREARNGSQPVAGRVA